MKSRQIKVLTGEIPKEGGAGKAPEKETARPPQVPAGGFSEIAGVEM